MKVSKLISEKGIRSPIIEAYKTLRTNIQFSGIDKDMRVILLTSADPSVGKSTTSANLAISMAQSDQRVLLIDCDLRKPAVHKLFHLVNKKGLTNILAEGIPYETICNEVGIPNLNVITSGPKPPNPSELLGSQKMKEVLDQIKKDYDVIVLDTPPVLAVTDAAVLSRVVDGVIFVVRYGRTTTDMAARAKENLDRVNANIIGTVINDIDSTSYGYTYYYYEYGSQKVDPSGSRK